jgi:maltooligosyltrehalose trehalohydrolase
MLFMGEEFAASAPFLFFCDFGPELAAAVAQGRRREFKRFAAFADDAALSRIADPNATATFTACKLDWNEREQPRHRDRLALIRRLLELRHRHLQPLVAKLKGAGRYSEDRGLLRLQWQLPTGDAWVVQVNFSAQSIYTEVPAQLVYAAGVIGGGAAGQGADRIESGGVVVGYQAKRR